VDPAVPLCCHADGRGTGYTHGGFAQGLRRLVRATGVRTPSGSAPRIHDLRHTFAVHALLRWYRAGADVQAKLPFLATYLGHVSVASTEYYLHFVAEIAAAASDRFARQCAALVTPGRAGEGGER
jgi:integrase